MLRRLALTLALLLASSPAWTQWQVPSGSIPVGKGPGATGFNTVTGSAGTGLKCLLDTSPPTFVTCPVPAYSSITGVPSHTFLGNNTGATANAIAMTQAQATAELNTFTSVLKGLVPASGGGTVNFLRADGTFQPIPIGITIGSTTVTGGTTLGELYNDGGVVGNLAPVYYDVRKYAVGPKTPSTVCNGSGDDTATIQAAIAAANSNAGGVVLFPASQCILASGLNLTNIRNVTLQGQSAGNNTSTSKTLITYTANTGSAMLMDGAIGIQVLRINWSYSSGTYNGDLFDLRQNAGSLNTNLISFKDCYVWGNSGTAASFWRLGQGGGAGTATLSFRLEHCLIQGAIQSVKGETNSNNIYIANNFFNTNTGTTSHIGIKGEGWTLLNNTFEPTAGTASNNVIMNGLTNGVFIAGNTFNDSGTGTLINLVGGVAQGLVITGNILQGGDFSINTGSAIGVTITGNSLSSNNCSNIIVNSSTYVHVAANNSIACATVGTLPVSTTPYFIDQHDLTPFYSSSGIRWVATTVANLPTCNAAAQGAQRFVTDANSVVFHATAVGGGANKVNVTCDGSIWYVN